MDERSASFKGLKRLRLPGMHLITARNGGMPIDQALGAFFFMMAHKQFRHNCLIGEQSGENHKTQSVALVFEEWSYLPENEILPFLVMGAVTSEQVQCWIAVGRESPRAIVKGFPLVERPQWAIKQSMAPPDTHIREAQKYVRKLQAEIENPATRAK